MIFLSKFVLDSYRLEIQTQNALNVNMKRGSMWLLNCSLRRGTLVLGHGGKHCTAHQHLVLLGLLGVLHNVADGTNEAHATTGATDEGKDDEGSHDIVNLTKEDG